MDQTQDLRSERHHGVQDRVMALADGVTTLLKVTRRRRAMRRW